MAFDYKKEYKEFYMPPKKPGMATSITTPPLWRSHYCRSIAGEGLGHSC